MSNMRTSPISPRTACGNSESGSSSRSKKDANPTVNKRVTMTAAVHRNHSRRSIRPMLFPIASVGMPALISIGDLVPTAVPGKPAPELMSESRRPDALCRLAVCANAPTSRLDTAFRAGHTAPTPFQILLSECVPMRILIAEGNAPLADFLRQRLVQEQFAGQLASDGTEAQRLAPNQPFDLVILDLNLPGAAGLDVLRNIRSRKPDLPVMVVTTSSMVEDRVRGLDAGADDYIAKPVAFAELAARIRAVLRRGKRAGEAGRNGAGS